MVSYIYLRYKNLLYLDLERVSSKLEQFSSAIVQKGARVSNLWAFIDGTVRGIARPGASVRDGESSNYLFQRSVYNGHKRKHALKFQTLSTPDGIIVHVYGPYPGRRHDTAMLNDSDLRARLRNDGRFNGYLIYGDPAYARDDIIWSPYPGTMLNDDESLNLNIFCRKLN
jgi:nuclease HARBI1